MDTLLIIDDNPDIRQQLKWGLSEEYSVLLAGDVAEGLAIFQKHQPKVVILDLGLPPCADTSDEGFRCLAEMMDIDQDVKVIMLTGNDERDNALKATQMGHMTFWQNPGNRGSFGYYQTGILSFKARGAESHVAALC